MDTPLEVGVPDWERRPPRAALATGPAPRPASRREPPAAGPGDLGIRRARGGVEGDVGSAWSRAAARRRLRGEAHGDALALCTKAPLRHTGSRGSWTLGVCTAEAREGVGDAPPSCQPTTGTITATTNHNSNSNSNSNNNNNSNNRGYECTSGADQSPTPACPCDCVHQT
jgi:hypothetical protein